MASCHDLMAQYKMNKKISTSLSLAIILVLALFVSAYALMQNRQINSSAYKQMALAKNSPMKSANCKVRAFEGSTNVAVWKINKNGQDILQVAKNDIAKLPVASYNSFKLIDQTPEITKELASSSESNPVEIAISGFVTKCDGTALACISYKDKIFQPYLAN